MQKILYFFIIVILSIQCSHAQINIMITNPSAEEVLLNDYDPATYAPTQLYLESNVVFDKLVNEISPDSLRSLLFELNTFSNRNAGSDSSRIGNKMGSAQYWALEKFQTYSAQNENRLLPSFMQFNQAICGLNQHRNVFAVLPGGGPQKDEIIIVEGHLDSRCESACDTDCIAKGIDDNGSGSVLVLELARVICQFAFNRTIVFMLTTAEEQGLLGANAFAQYCEDNQIKIHAVFNNDIVGGIICGTTASPPGCPGLNAIDSINLRLYSAGTLNSKHKSLARFTKLEYVENIMDKMAVKTQIQIMTAADRSGRGGDHIPFHQRGYAALRFTSANEHGNGNPSTPDYSDRQHTFNDILGIDTNNDQQIDSFFVDFNYLARNTIINANAMVTAAWGPIPPTSFDITAIDGGFHYEINDPNNYGKYRIGARTFSNNDFDTVFTVNSAEGDLFGLSPGLYLLSLSSVDNKGLESLFIGEKTSSITTDVEEVLLKEKKLELLQNRPNPFDEITTIGVLVHQSISYEKAEVLIQNTLGQILARYPIALNLGINEVKYEHRHHQFQTGVYSYSLLIDGKVYETKQMVYAY